MKFQRATAESLWRAAAAERQRSRSEADTGRCFG